MAAIGKPQNARSRRTREALLAAARNLIEEEGFEAMTLATVAERAGVSHRALYLHFPSRAELLTSLYRHLGETEDLASSLGRVWEAADSVSALDEWAYHIARAHPRIMGVLRAVEHARHSDADAAQMWNTTMRNWHLGCRRIIEWLERDNQLASTWTIDTATDMLWALMSQDMLERLIVDKRWSPKRYGRFLAALLHSAFVGPRA